MRTGKAYWKNHDEWYESRDIQASIVTPSPHFNAGDIVRPDIKIDLTILHGGVTYKALLKRAPQDGWVIGSWKALETKDEGHCQAKLFTCLDGSYGLIGTWKESSISYEWLLFLHNEKD